MGWIPAAIGAGAGIFGDILASQGTKATNAMNYKIWTEQRDWQTEMANTQMQRRVEDLQKAGLNPLLATGQQGAAVPNVAAPQMQNDKASFGNLGGQIASALQLAQLKASVRLTDAQAGKLEAETPGGTVIPLKDDGTPDWQAFVASGAPHQIGTFTALTQAKMVEQLDWTTKKIQQDIKTGESQVGLNEAYKAVSELNAEQLKAMMEFTVRSAAAKLRIDMATATVEEVEAQLYSGPSGVWIRALEKAGAPSAVTAVLKGVMSKRGPVK